VALESILLFRGFPRKARFPLSRILFLHRLRPDSDVFCMAFARLNTQESYNSVYWTAELCAFW